MLQSSHFTIDYICRVLALLLPLSLDCERQLVQRLILALTQHSVSTDDVLDDSTSANYKSKQINKRNCDQSDNDSDSHDSEAFVNQTNYDHHDSEATINQLDDDHHDSKPSVQQTSSTCFYSITNKLSPHITNRLTYFIACLLHECRLEWEKLVDNTK